MPARRMILNKRVLRFLAGLRYPTLHVWVNYENIESIRLWYNNVPPGGSAKCHLGPLKALPLRKSRLSRPSLSIGLKTLTFPVDMETASYLEFNTLDDCKIYDARGELIGQVRPEGEVPLLDAGDNTIRFSHEGAQDVKPRVRVTTITRGDPL